MPKILRETTPAVRLPRGGCPFKQSQARRKQQEEDTHRLPKLLRLLCRRWKHEFMKIWTKIKFPVWWCSRSKRKLFLELLEYSRKSHSRRNNSHFCSGKKWSYNSIKAIFDNDLQVFTHLTIKTFEKSSSGRVMNDIYYFRLQVPSSLRSLAIINVIFTMADVYSSIWIIVWRRTQFNSNMLQFWGWIAIFLTKTFFSIFVWIGLRLNNWKMITISVL